MSLATASNWLCKFVFRLPCLCVCSVLHHVLCTNTHTDFGAEKAVSVQGLDAAAVQKKLSELVKAGESMPK